MTHAAPPPLPTSAAVPASVPLQRRGIAAVVAGNALEFYDFVCYAYFAVYIGRTFFPAEQPMTSLLLAVATFGVGFLTRPLGAWLIGSYADRAGRKPAMLLSVGLMTVGTAALGLMPGYASIGIAAPLGVVACRLLQGLALGGEVGAATALLVETAPPPRRGLYASWQLAGQGIAVLTAGIVGLVLTLALGPERLAEWGWRVPFLLALVALPLTLRIRARLPETLPPSAVAATGTSPLRGLWRDERGLVGLAILVTMTGTVSTYVAGYLSSYAVATLKLPPQSAMAATAAIGVGTIVGALGGGWLADRFGRKPLMVWPRLAIALAVWPAFWLLASRPATGVLVALAATLALLTAASGAASLVLIVERLPAGVRAIGLSAIYAVGVAIFGGGTQPLVTALIAATGDPLVPAYVVIVTSVIGLWAMSRLPETRGHW